MESHWYLLARTERQLFESIVWPRNYKYTKWRYASDAGDDVKAMHELWQEEWTSTLSHRAMSSPYQHHPPARAWAVLSIPHDNRERTKQNAVDVDPE